MSKTAVKGKRLKEYIICTVLPFIIPFILEVPDAHLSKKAAGVIIFIISAIYVIWSFAIYTRGQAESQITFNNKASRYAFSNAYILAEEKRDCLIEQTYNKPDYCISQNMIPYNVHNYIGNICKEFKNVISEITGITKEYLSVSFIYKYSYEGVSKEDAKWKWIIGRELTNNVDLNVFVKKRDTVYNYLLTKNEGYVFANKKADLLDESNPENNHYYFSKRDKMHKKEGSIFSVRIMFSNNAKQFVDSILTISSYGKFFTEPENEDVLRNLIIEELLPYYQRCLETELGYLYLRHDHGLPQTVV